MRLLITFARAYPLQSALMLFALVLAGIVEGAGLSVLLPLLGMAADNRGGTAQTPTADAVTGESIAGHPIIEALRFLGLEPSAGVLLFIIIFCHRIKKRLRSAG